MQNNARKFESEPLQPKGPYVGLRPYEREERCIFFGRDRDAQFLTDKIFSAKLTILYSLSGLGKSSMLRTIVIPRLEEENSRVVYFDDWTGDKPADSLKEKLVRLAEKMGIPDPDAGAPTLTELVRLLRSHDDRTLVLILDQFEDFLVSHGQRLDPLRKELSRLVRAGSLDVHVLISLRQEYLASLEPFRKEILKLFESTYHLEHLDDQGVSDAIQLPAEVFGATFETELVEALKGDLSINAEDDITPETLAPIRLPMMQLVCSELWEAARKSGQSMLTLDLYRQLGGAPEILEAYVRKVMPVRRSDRRLTARLMQFLAPSSGLKMSYSVDDLADITGLKQVNIKTELERLSRLRILRTRQFRTEQRFELEHDAFIKIVSPWRDEILRRARWSRRAKWVAGCFLLVMIPCVVFFYIRYVENQSEFHKNTEGVMTKLRKMSSDKRASHLETEFDSATLYLLKKGPDHFEDLRNLLKENRDLLPVGYGLERFSIDESVSIFESKWPFKLRYSSDRSLSLNYFSQTWQLIAQKFTEIWGIPVPRRIHLVKDPFFSKEVMYFYDFHGNDLNGLYFEVPAYEEHALINSKNLPEPAKSFFDRLNREWTHIDQLQKLQWDVPSSVVPRWSLPVWSASGLRATDGSGLPAFLLATNLQDKPELLCTQDAIDYLIYRVSEKLPQTVREARLARMSNLRIDLLRMIELGHPLLDLPLILDALAQYPDKAPEEVAKLVDQDLKLTDAKFPDRLHGPWKDRAESAEGQVHNVSSIRPKLATVEHLNAYEDVEEWLPHVKSEIRVYLGKNLESRWLVTDYAPIATLQERLSSFRDAFFRKFGFEFPPVKFIGDPSLAGEAFQIEEMPNENTPDPDAQLVVGKDHATLDDLFDGLLSLAKDPKVRWLDADQVQMAKEDAIDPILGAWLDQRFSLTDLKLLLRAVVSPTLAELRRKDIVADGDFADMPLENSLRHINWLLGSLIFWSRVDDPLDLKQMARHLRDTQKARIRFERKDTTTSLTAADSNISKGIQAIEEGHFSEAETTFDQTINENPDEAVENFLLTYPKIIPSKLRKHFAKKCRDLNFMFFKRSERIDLEELLVSVGTKIETKEKRNLKLCLFSGYRDSTHRKECALASELFAEFGMLSEWSAAEAGWFGIEVLRNFDPLEDDTELLEKAKALLKSAVTRFDEDKNLAAFSDLMNVCNQGGIKNWCWEFLNEWAEVRPDRDILLALAFNLSASKRRVELERALALAEQAQKKIESDDLSSEKREWLQDIARFYRARALIGLTGLGIEDYWIEAEALLRDLSDSTTVGLESYLERANWMLSQGRYDETEVFIEAALKEWPASCSFYIIKFWVNLFKGDTDRANEIIDEAISKAGKNSETVFVKALYQILTGQGHRALQSLVFLEKELMYADYLTLLLYATQKHGIAKDQAKQRLKWRWSQIDSDKWQKRLSGGDPMAWQEMLIGYCLGEVTSFEIFGVLEEDEAFANSNFSHVPLSRQGMLCQAYFLDAMLSQAKGDDLRNRLQKVLDTNQREHYEYKMAKFLLEREHSERLTAPD